MPCPLLTVGSGHGIQDLKVLWRHCTVGSTTLQSTGNTIPSVANYPTPQTGNHKDQQLLANSVTNTHWVAGEINRVDRKEEVIYRY